MSDLHESLFRRRLLVCVGAGGVGKTSVAAALALSRALAGGRALVCTIDPARRLAGALGLSALGNAETRVPEARMKEAGLSPRGQLYAMMLDVKRTWDDLVTRHAPDPARRERILANRLYQQMSAALAGSQEYMAMEKLYQLASDSDYDLIVLDTPPTANALDFLDAPARLIDFLGNDAARALLAPALGAGRLGLRLAQLGGGYAAKALARFTGQQALADLGQFLQSFQGMYDGFKARAAAVRDLLSRPEVGFVLVTSPSPRALLEARSFHDRLSAESMPVAGMVVNRLTPELWQAPSPLPGALDLEGPLFAAAPDAARQPGVPLSKRLAENLAEHEALAAAEREAVKKARQGIVGPCAMIPRLQESVHDLSALASMAERL